MQRIFDIFFSAIAILVLLPLFAIVAIVLMLTGESEIFFLQERVGQNGIKFKIYKFATMLKDSPNMMNGSVTVNSDSRVLPVGKILRKTKINELPQLFNILIGDMSVVGPRPQTKICFDAYPDQLKLVISKVRPGLSGLGPIVFRGEENIIPQVDGNEFYNSVIAPYKAQVEAWYVENQNLIIYFSVILVTLWVILFPSSKAVWFVFKNLPVPPDNLKKSLNFPISV